MRALRVLGARLLALVGRRRSDAELEEELRSHIELVTDENVAKGMAPAEARAAALRAFGGVEQAKDLYRDQRGFPAFEALLLDLRYGARVLRNRPGFTLIAVLTLALGIGANTAVFQLVDALRLRSLPVRDPQQLVEVRIAGGNGGMGVNMDTYAQLTRPLWAELEARRIFPAGAFAWSFGRYAVGNRADNQSVKVLQASGELFRALGVQHWRGRLLLPEDTVAACPANVVVVSHAYWQRMLGGRTLDGATLVIDGEVRQIVGVTPPEFFGLAVGETFDVALPLCRPPEVRRDLFELTVMGRLAPGQTLAQASAQLRALSPAIFAATEITGYSAKTTARYRTFRLEATPASGGVSSLRDSYASSLSLLLAITALVLLIACSNLANLMLARATARGQEIAVRLALGASRRRLLQQLLAESGLLVGLGALAGLGLAQLLSRTLVGALSTDGAVVELTVDTDWRILLFATAAAACSGVVFGVLPALRATGAGPLGGLGAAGRTLTTGKERVALQRLLVSVQIAVSLVLLFGSLLLVRSFYNLVTFDPGMREDGITVARFDFERAKLPRSRWEPFQRELLDEVRALPGVLGVATTTNVPLFGGSWGHGVHVGEVDGSSRFTWVSPGYFAAMGIPLLAGRDLGPDDTAASARVAVVNHAFVSRYLAGVDPIGKTVRTDPEPHYPSTTYQIVGVVADTSYNSLRSGRLPMTFAPAPQFPNQRPGVAMMIHAAAPPAVLMAEVKRAMTAKHPDVSLFLVDFQRRIRDGMVREQLMAMLSGFFAVLAALLAMLGLYGVISYLVTRRRKEIGIRLALGARAGQVLALVMGEAGRMLAVGLLVGIGCALAVGRAASTLLFGLAPHDPSTLALACGLLVASALAASFLPARRAARTDPTAALRDE
jgi:predicted permease